jgi:wyosine [tRNA(Phe)-imidazoG37] synthetase (radical SAM superfamily)
MSRAGVPVTYVYGPVPSWRLGRSLGVDPVPLKTCNWNCAYCQLGRTQPLVNERRDYVPVEALVTELRQALAMRAPDDIDWVTFVGSGEPLLHAHLGNLLRAAKAMTNHPLALITNGSLLCRSDVRDEVAVADAVLPTLDVGSPELYRRLNRPHPEVTFDGHVQGLIAFRDAYRGRLWLEVMLVKGVNDTDPALDTLASWLARIRPDEIHLNTPSRPAVELWVQPPDRASVRRAAQVLGRVAPVRVPTTAAGAFDLGRCENVVDAVAAILQRHPMSEQELVRTLAHRSPEHVREALAALEVGGRARVVVRNGVCFWVSAAAHFPDETGSGPGGPV